MQRFAARWGHVVLAVLWAVGWAAVFAVHAAMPAPPTARIAQGFVMPYTALFTAVILCAGSNTKRHGGHKREEAR